MKKDFTAIMVELKNDNYANINSLYSEIRRLVLIKFSGIINAEDFTQDVVVELIRTRHKFDETKSEGGFYTWIKFIMGTVYDRKYKNKSQKPKLVSMYEFIDEEWINIIDWYYSTPSAESEYLREEMTATLRRTIKELPENYRKAIILKYFMGLKCNEIAKKMNCSEHDVSNYIYRALNKLRSNMEIMELKEIYYSNNQVAPII